MAPVQSTTDNLKLTPGLLQAELEQCQTMNDELTAWIKDEKTLITYYSKLAANYRTTLLCIAMSFGLDEDLDAEGVELEGPVLHQRITQHINALQQHNKQLTQELTSSKSNHYWEDVSDRYRKECCSLREELQDYRSQTAAREAALTELQARLAIADDNNHFLTKRNLKLVEELTVWQTSCLKCFDIPLKEETS